MCSVVAHAYVFTGNNKRAAMTDNLLVVIHIFLINIDIVQFLLITIIVRCAIYHDNWNLSYIYVVKKPTGLTTLLGDFEVNTYVLTL